MVALLGKVRLELLSYVIVMAAVADKDATHTFLLTSCDSQVQLNAGNALKLNSTPSAAAEDCPRRALALCQRDAGSRGVQFAARPHHLPLAPQRGCRRGPDRVHWFHAGLEVILPAAQPTTQMRSQDAYGQDSSYQF